MLGKLLFGAAAAGAAAWFMKKDERAKAYVERYAGQAKGAVSSVAPGAGRAPAEERLNDPALARKVESEIFREGDIPKGSISLNVEHGVVYLRGELPDRQQMDELVARTRKVDGVRGVENLTHLPSEPAPTKDEAAHGAGERTA
jgi:osmotically-inducible protein OsmY